MNWNACPQGYNKAAAKPTATATDAPSTEEASKAAAPPVLVAAAGLALLALGLVPAG